MPNRMLAKQIDAFELELSLVETLIDRLGELAIQDLHFHKTFNDLQQHRLQMRKTYDVIRPELFHRLH